jgi:hypothetical protein
MATAADTAAIEQVLANTATPLRVLVAELMDAVRKLHPDVHVLAWPKQQIISFGFGPKKMTEHYFYIGVHGKHINAGFYYGATLPDPSGLLEGTGKNLRHLKVRSLEDARRAALAALITAAKSERDKRLATIGKANPLKSQMLRNAETINRLNARVDEAARERNANEAARRAWQQAANEFHTRYDQLAFPGGLERAKQRILAGDADAMEAALAFLECRPYFFRSGYIYKDLLRIAKKAPLTDDQKTRLSIIAARDAEHRACRQTGQD